MRRWLGRLGVPEISFAVFALIIIADSAAGLDPLLQWAIGLGLGLVYLIVFAAWSEFRKDRDLRGVFPRGGWFIAGVVVGLATFFTQWPLRVQFYLVRGELDRIADRIELGQSVKTPVRVGAFVIRKVEMRYDSYPALMLNPNPMGPTSLIRTPGAIPVSWERIHLGQDWYLYSED